MKPLLLPGLMALLAVSTVSAAEANWPQFHGPGGGGVAEPSDPPVLFGPDTAVLWKIPFPAGNSSPCIWGDRIFLTAFDQGALEAVCVRRGDGSVLWRRAAPATKAESTHRLGSPATPTPTTDGRLVFAYFGSYGLIAYDLDGTERWRLPLRTPVVEFGTSASPVLSDGRLFLACDQDEGSFLLAVDAATGRTLWRVERPEFRRSFATPFLWRHDGSEELVVPGSIWLKSYRPSDGRELWTYSGTSRVACSSPVAGDGLLFSASWNVGGDADSRVTMEPFDEFVRGIGKDADAVLSRESIPAGPVRERFTQIDLNKDDRVTRAEWEGMRSMFARAGNAVLAIRPGGTNDITASHLAWKSTRSLPYVASPLFENGRLYTVKNGGLVSCYRASTGQPLYQDHRIDAPGDYYASIVAGHGRLYFTSQKGVVTVLAAGDTPEVLGRVDLGESVMATPAIVGDTLFVRTESSLYAFRQSLR
jgi:outer membrane protein assembly factor BamB